MMQKTSVETQRAETESEGDEMLSDASAATDSAVAELPEAQPFDEHNRRLIDNVHPSNWVNPQPSGRYNMVVIGAGTAGLVTAAGAAGLGAKVALIERHLMGGDCLNVGCVPSKALIRCARALGGNGLGGPG